MRHPSVHKLTGFYTPTARIVGLGVLSLDSIIKNLFSNNEKGFAFDFGDMTNDKLNWRSNLFTYTEFSNGVADAPTRGGNVSATTLTGFRGALQFTSGGDSYAYKSVSSLPNGISTFSFYMVMDDKSQPKLGTSSLDTTVDACIVFQGGTQVATAITLIDSNLGIYRVSVTAPITIANAYFGIVKYSANTGKGFKVTGYQLEVGNLSAYQSFTDFNSEFLAAFPNHTLLQDSAGTTPTVLPSQPIGLTLDKGKGLALGSELIPQPVNFALWSKTASVTNTVGGTFTTNATGGCTLGIFGSGNKNTHVIQIKGTSTIAGVIRNGSDTTGQVAFNAGTVNIVMTNAIIASSGSSIYIQLNGAGTFTASSISIRPIAGNHAYQTTSASRPILGRHPKTGARNLLTYSSNAMDSSWMFTGGNRLGGQLDSRGTYKATQFTGTSTGPTIKTFTATVTGAHTFTIRAKAVSGKGNTAQFLMRNNTTATNFVFGNVNLATGVITGEGWTSKSVANGYWEYTYTQTTGITKGDSMQVYFGATSIVDSTFGIIIDYAQVESGSVATAFQDTTTLQDITEIGVDSCWFAYFDGVDDFLQTNSIDFSATATATIFTGLRKLADSSAGVFYELSANTTTNNGSFYSSCGGSGGLESYNSAVKGTNASPSYASAMKATYPQYSAPHSSVHTALLDLVNAGNTLRINGVVAASAGVQTLGSFGNYPLYIGRRGGTTLPFNGNMYNLVGVGRVLTQAEIVNLEKSIALRSGVSL